MLPRMTATTYRREEMHDQVLRGTRILAELGADAIKTFYTHKFKDVVEGCPDTDLRAWRDTLTTTTPVDSLQLAADEIADGAKGVVFGRNAIQREDPDRISAGAYRSRKKRYEPQRCCREIPRLSNKG